MTFKCLKISAIFILIFSYVSVMGFQGKVSNSKGSCPFSKAELKNTHDAYRSFGSGKSSIESVAKSMAMLDAKARMTRRILAAYNKCYPGQNKKQLILDNTEEVKVETVSDENGEDVTWVIIEVDKSDVWKELFGDEGKLGRSEQIKKFEKELNSK